MSRNRLTWNQNRRASRNKFADPYTMNQERTHVPTENYMVGDPDEWAETPVADLGHMDGTGRDEIGLPAMDLMDPDHDWNDGSYDNDKQASRIASMQRHFEKKALHCLRIAEAMLPGADEDKLAEQALDLMDLPDENVVATSSRLSSFLGYASEDEEMEDEEDKEAKGKKANLTPDEMLRIMLAEEHEEEEEEGKESSIREIVAQELANLFSKNAGKKKSEDDDEDEDESEEEESEEDSEEEGESKEEESKDSKKKANSIREMVRDIMAEQGYSMESMDDDMGDEDIDALLNELEMEEDYVGADMGLDMEPSMDDLDSEVLLEETDETLEAIMNRHYSVGGRTAKKASGKKSKGVKSLGRVKEAGSADDDLSRLWGMAPDVSKVFGK